MTIELEGRAVPARAGQSVAVALLVAGERILSRSVKYHRPRGFFCLSGHCGACLMRIDGRPNIKACRTPVSHGLKIERQNTFPSGRFDVLGAADFLFARGMDHHTMMTSPRALNQILQKVVRELGGLGRLPDERGTTAIVRAQHPASGRRHFRVAVVGGGPAGLAVATATATAGLSTVIVDQQLEPGGSYLTHPAHGRGVATERVAAALAAGAELWSTCTAFAWYGEDIATALSNVDARPGLLAVDGPHGLVELTAESYVYATGSYEQNALFVDNDRPGVMAARAVGRLLLQYGVLPARRPIVVGDGPYALALAEALTERGAQVTRIDGNVVRPVAAHGRGWVRSLEVADGSTTRKIACDLVAVAARPAPASELLRMHGAAVAFSDEGGGFICRTDEETGATDIGGVFAAGDVCGARDPVAAAADGARIGAAVAQSLAG